MKTLRTAAIVIALVAILAGCVETSYAPQDETPQLKLAVIGDTNVSQLADLIHYQWDDNDPNRGDQMVGGYFFSTMVGGVDDARLDDLDAVADQYAATNPDIVIVYAGQLDALDGNPNAVADRDDLYARFPNSCIVQVGINEDNVDTPGYDNSVALALNDNRFYDEGHIYLDFEEYIRRHGQSTMFSDGINLTTVGQGVWNGHTIYGVELCMKTTGRMPW
jgi:hypothetical protein